jgi:hypothetical protein
MRTGVEQPNRVGLVLFWIAVIGAIFLAVIVSMVKSPLLHTLTLEELNQTIWAPAGPMNILWGQVTPLLALVAGIGILIYSRTKGSMVWKFGIGIFVAFIIAFGTSLLGHFRPLFIIGGTLILLLGIGILWLMAKERMALNGSSTTAADFKLVGYVFHFMAAWYI